MTSAKPLRPRSIAPALIPHRLARLVVWPNRGCPTVSTILSRRDLAFLLYEWLDVESLTARPRFAEHSRETFDGVLDLSEQIATREFAPHNHKNDAQEPTFDGEKVHVIDEVRVALDAFYASGLLPGSMDEAVGGLQLPQVVQRACFAWFQAANIATSSYPMLTMANANLLLAYATEEQVGTYVRPMLEGRFTGTMCLSEPQAGSSLSDVTTRADRGGRRHVPDHRQQDVDLRR